MAVATRELLQRVRRIEIRTRRLVDELTGGAYHSVFKGRGIEFDEVREYQPGDDVRAIDWNVTARAGHPYIKKFVEERELTVMLLVDVSASMAFGSAAQEKREMAAELGALLAFSAIRNQDRAGLLLYSDHEELHLPARKGRRQVLRLLRELLAWEGRGVGTRLGAGLELLSRTLHRKAVVFVVSDFLTDDWEGPIRLLNRRHDVVAIRLLDPLELALPAAGWVALEDAETGARVVAPAGQRTWRQRHATQAQTLADQVPGTLRRLGVDFIDLRTGSDYLAALMRFFNQRRARARHGGARPPGGAGA